MKNIEQPTGFVETESSGQQNLERRLRKLEKSYEPYSVTQDYTFSDSDTIDSLQVDATAGNVTITLPSPTGSRRRRVIKTDSSSNTVTITAGGITLINANISITLFRRFRPVTLEPTGTGWLIVSGSSGLATANGSVFLGQSVLATNATDGFLYVPTCAGTPTGVPNNLGTYCPIVVDTTNNKLYFYSSSAWRDAGP